MNVPFFIVSAILFLQDGLLQRLEMQNFAQQQNNIVAAHKREKQQKQQQKLEFYRSLISKNKEYKRTKIQDRNRIQQPLKQNKK